MFGVLNINKPLHCTSHDVVAKVRKLLGIKKVGHCGTLDPLAGGVLPVCVGSATRLIEYFPSDKRYRAEITFGATTPTWDAEGTVETHEPSPPADLQNELCTLMEEFTGVIQQQVPPHAAVHVNGKKLYEYTRKGIAVELPVREATIFDISLVNITHDDGSLPQVTLDIHCASGTYIRSIAQALGEKTGYGAYLSGLTRTAHGNFVLDDSIDLDTLINSSDPTDHLMNPTALLPLPQIDLPSSLADKIRHGLKLDSQDLHTPVKNNTTYLLTHQQTTLAIAKGEASGRLKPIKVFLYS